MPASCAGFYEATTSRPLFRPQALQIGLTILKAHGLFSSRLSLGKIAE